MITFIRLELEWLIIMALLCEDRAVRQLPNKFHCQTKTNKKFKIREH